MSPQSIRTHLVGLVRRMSQNPTNINPFRPTTSADPLRQLGNITHIHNTSLRSEDSTVTIRPDRRKITTAPGLLTQIKRVSTARCHQPETDEVTNWQ